ncbi:nicotinate-nucleotide-dimethylbenzimidazole phosphoribosyltransferase [Lachnospiraceae bacterium XBB2008]|nr:nicotinate-nucleotide-dimethylbenzimidazole phosphoribosyltransferase [Lachnospiraceae bacterium XBB2008]
MTLDDLYGLKADKPSESDRMEARRRLDAIAKPIDGLGDMEKMLCRIAAIRRTPDFDMDKKALIIMCADNGVVAEGVTQTESAVTARVAHLMGQRKSSAGIMSVSYPIDILTVDIGIDSNATIPGIIDRKVRCGTGNITVTAAMSAGECLQAIETGVDLVRDLEKSGYSLIATGEMGIGNTTTATAVMCALCNKQPEEVTGRGAGLDDEGLKRKVGVIKRALAYHGMDKPADDEITGRDMAFKALRTLGGLDIAGLTGIFIGGAICHIPVVIDGLISATAALCADMIVTGCREYMLASHNGREAGCGEILERLGLHAVIDADLALGEGSGALLLMPMLDMAYSLYIHGTRFGSDVGIDHYERFDEK